MPPPPGSAQRPSPHTCPPVRAPRTVTEGVSGRRGLKRRGRQAGPVSCSRRSGGRRPHPARPALAPAPAAGAWLVGSKGVPTRPPPWPVNGGRRGPGLRGLRLAPASRSCGEWERGRSFLSISTPSADISVFIDGRNCYDRPWISRFIS